MTDFFICFSLTILNSLCIKGVRTRSYTQSRGLHPLLAGLFGFDALGGVGYAQ